MAATRSTIYYPGGYLSGAVALNRKEEYDVDAATYTTWDQSGNQTSQRALTASEIAALSTVPNQIAIQAKAQAALTANATFLALSSPTNAQTLAQVQTLTRECSALIRLALNLLDTTAGT